jgi:copper homeostasis protein
MPRSVEICLTDFASAVASARGGADRIELCADLASGGLTPSLGLMTRVIADSGLPTHVLIRPRAGDFVYDPDEIASMALDIDAASRLGASGVVLGALRPDRTIDAEILETLIARARPMSVTFHKAIDLVPDPLDAIETLIRLGVDRVLTSGGPGPARANVAALCAMARHASGRLIVMAGGGIEADDLPGLLDATGIEEVHLGSGVTGPAPSPGPFGARPAAVEVEQVRRIVRLVKG